MHERQQRTTVKPNAVDGIAPLDEPSSDNTPKVTIGGTAPDSRNIISGSLGTRNLGENGDSGVGIYTAAVSSVHVEGNFIGTDVNGEAAISNRGGGISVTFAIYTGDFVIGGTAPGAGNLISGNGQGVAISGCMHVNVQGNFIGTDFTGTHGLPGQGRGILGYNGANPHPDILIGGTESGAGNVISGQTSGIGIDIRSGETVVQGNLIGTDSTGTTAIANFAGIYLADSASGNLIGGSTPAARNATSGNLNVGVCIASHPDVTDNVIHGNFIGTDITGTKPLGNPYGIWLASPKNQVGGETPGTGNVIFSNSFGVVIGGALANKNVVEGNFIGTDLTGTINLGGTTTGSSEFAGGHYLCRSF